MFNTLTDNDSFFLIILLINIKVSSSEQQIADQRKRKAKEKEAKVDWWELRKPPANEFQVYNFVENFFCRIKSISIM